MNKTLKTELVFELRSLLKVQFELTHYPKLDSQNKFVKKGLKLLDKYTPKLSSYLSKQKALNKLPDCSIRINSKRKRKHKTIKKVFNLWIKKEKLKRIILLILEGSILPLTPILAVLPGPNIFFYCPFLLFYFHYKSYLGLKGLPANPTVNVTFNPSV